MDRRTELLRFIDRDQVGIEIGPWHTPLAPKRDGYRSLSIDVFDTDTLRRRAVEDPHIDAAAVHVPTCVPADCFGAARPAAGSAIMTTANVTGARYLILDTAVSLLGLERQAHDRERVLMEV